MTQAFNLAQLANNLNTSGQLDATDGLNGLVANANLASSGSPSSSTYLRGDRTWSALPSLGKILQVVQATKTDVWSSNSLGSVWNDIPGQGGSGTFQVQITPSSTSSRILILSHLPMSSTASQVGRSQLQRNGTAIFTGDAAGTRPLGVGQTYFSDVAFGNQSSVTMQDLGCVFVDSPSTTSTLTYKMVVGADNTGGAGTVRLNLTNRDSNGTGTDTRAASSIIVMEIGA